MTSDLDPGPLARLEPDRGKQKARDLIRQHAEPDAGDPPAERDAAYVGEERPDHSHTDRRRHRGISRVARTAQAAHVDDLRYLE